MPCHFFTLQSSDGRSFQEEVVQHVSEDLRVSTHPCDAVQQATHNVRTYIVHVKDSKNLFHKQRVEMYYRDEL